MDIGFPYILPSQGKLYGSILPEGKVELYPMRGQHEEILAGAGEGQNAILMLRQITQLLIKFSAQNFNQNELLITDWVACVIQIMAISQGQYLSLKPKCPVCKKTSTKIQHINTLPTRTAEELNNYQEPFTTAPLPFSGEIIQFKLQRIKDLQKIEDYSVQAIRKVEESKTNATGTYALALQLLSINGKTNLSELELMRWIRGTIRGDLNFLRNEISSRETGFDMNPKFNCQSCGEEFTVPLPMDGRFFCRDDTSIRTT